jgi:N-methylhydantoinase A
VWAPDRVAGHARRAVYFGPEHGQFDAPVLSRHSLGRTPRAGPLLIQEYDTTIVVPPDCNAAVDDHGNVVIGIGT